MSNFGPNFTVTVLLGDVDFMKKDVKIWEFDRHFGVLFRLQKQLIISLQ